MVTAEEHQRNGGLGESVAAVLSSNAPAPIEIVAVNDSFGESGKPVELLDKYGLSAAHVEAAVEKVLGRK